MSKNLAYVLCAALLAFAIVGVSWGEGSRSRPRANEELSLRLREVKALESIATSLAVATAGRR